MDALPISIPRQAGLYVRREREAQGLTRSQLAIASGVSERSLASLELGDASGIRLDKLLAVYDALGLSLLTQGESITRKQQQGTAGKASDTRQKRHVQQSHPARKPKPTSKQKSLSTDSYNEVLRDFILNNTDIGPTDDFGHLGPVNGR